jgi:hypothetical protein cfetvA_05799
MKNIDKYLKDFLFRVGSGVAQVAKEKTAPIRTGNLKRDIRVFEANASEVKIGNTLKIKYAKYVHSGTRAYTIKPKNKKALANKKAGLFFGKKVKHPGIKANPYLLNAWNIYKNGGLKRASDELTQNVGKEIVKEIKITLKG